MCQCIECIGDQYEPDQIDMMSESELRSELRKLLGTLAAEQEAHAATKQQLAAEQEASKKADADLKHTLAERDAYMRGMDFEKQRAEAAEAIIKTSREPVGYMIKLMRDGTYTQCAKTHPHAFPVFTLQPDVAELQRNLSNAITAQNELHEQYYQLQRENSELQRQLEEASEDAARYRFIRNSPGNPSPEEFDSAVDADIAAPTTDQPKE